MALSCLLFKSLNYPIQHSGFCVCVSDSGDSSSPVSLPKHSTLWDVVGLFSQPFSQSLCVLCEYKVMIVIVVFECFYDVLLSAN